jgi:hypothetical protein
MDIYMPAVGKWPENAFGHDTFLGHSSVCSAVPTSNRDRATFGPPFLRQSRSPHPTTTSESQCSG